MSQRHFKVFAWMIYQRWRKLLGSFFLYDVDIVEGSFVGELARRSVQKQPNTVRLLRYNSHTCYVANIHVLFNALSCPTCDCHFNRPGNLERHLTTCQERVKQVYPKNVYQLKKKHFLTSWIPSIYLTWTRSNCLKMLQSLISNQFVYGKMSSKTRRQQDGLENMFQYLYQYPPTYYKILLFICNSNPRELVSFCVNALENLAAQSKPQMRMSSLR